MSHFQTVGAKPEFVTVFAKASSVEFLLMQGLKHYVHACARVHIVHAKAL